MSGSIKSEGGGTRKASATTLVVRSKLEDVFGCSGSSKELATLHAETFALNLKVSALYEALLHLTDKVEEVLAHIHHDKESIASGSASGKDSIDTFESAHTSLAAQLPMTEPPSSELMTALTQPEKRKTTSPILPRKSAPVAAPRRRRQPAGRKSGARSRKNVRINPPTLEETGPLVIDQQLPKAGRPKKIRHVNEEEEKETLVKSPIATRSRSRSGPIKITLPKNIFRTMETAAAESEESAHTKDAGNYLNSTSLIVQVDQGNGTRSAGETTTEEPVVSKMEVDDDESKADETNDESEDEMPLAAQHTTQVDRGEGAGPSVAEALLRDAEGGANSSKKRKHEEKGNEGNDFLDEIKALFTKPAELLPSLLVREAPASAAVGVRKGVQKPGLEHKVSSDAHRKWKAFVQSEIKKLMERKEWPEIMSKLGLTFHKIMQSEASPIFDKIMGSTKEFCETEKLACPSAQNVAYAISTYVKAKTAK